jgi:CBS domain-containing protein
MTTRVSDVMTKDVIAMRSDTPIVEASKAMRDRAIGDVVVLEGDQVSGIVTDRDIVVRAIAEGRSPSDTTIGEIASSEVTTLAPDDDVDVAVGSMRQRAFRRLPVVESGRPVGIVSLGDLAVALDRESALADISAAPPTT